MQKVNSKYDPIDNDSKDLFCSSSEIRRDAHIPLLRYTDTSDKFENGFGSANDAAQRKTHLFPFWHTKIKPANPSKIKYVSMSYG